MSKNRVHTKGHSNTIYVGASSADAYSDHRLLVEYVDTGQPDFVAPGDTVKLILSIRCWCRSTLGVVRRVDRGHRALDPLLIVHGQIILSTGQRTTMRRIERLFEQDWQYERGYFGYPGAFPSDCASHGRQVLTVEELRKPVSKALHRVLTGQAAPTYYIPRPV